MTISEKVDNNFEENICSTCNNINAKNIENFCGEIARKKQ
jgi:hypothetical protein